MVSLIRLLKEAKGAPKAIIMAGAPGAGKTSIVKDIIADLGLKVLNIDDFFIKNLQDAGISLDLKRADTQGKEGARKAMGLAQQEYRGVLQREIGTKSDIVIDSTAADYNKIAKLKKILEAAGYDVLMVYVYASLEKSLKKNEDRFERSLGKDRSIMPSLVLKIWAGVTRNFEPYLNLFNQNFVAVSKDKDPFSQKNLKDIIKRYIEPFEQGDVKLQAELEDEILQLRNKENIQNIIQQTVSKEEAQNKIKTFLNS